MRLLLASSHPALHRRHLSELAHPGATVAVVANAIDTLIDFPREDWVADETRMLQDAGLAPFELDLRRYDAQPAERLAEALAGVDVVWATGGNVFVLRDALRRSGLDALLRARLADDSIAYGGVSAGACVCGPTLRGLEHVDDAGAVPEPIWEGLGLVGFSIAPHYRSGGPEGQAIERVVEYFRARAMPYQALRDGQAIVVRGGSPRTVDALRGTRTARRLARVARRGAGGAVRRGPRT